MRKSEFFIFLCELPLILGVGENKTRARDVYVRTTGIEFERDRSIGLDSMFGDGQTNKQTGRHTHTHTHKHTHTFLVCESDIESKTIKNIVNHQRI